jgi:hypothetical protein
MREERSRGKELRSEQKKTLRKWHSKPGKNIRAKYYLLHGRRDQMHHFFVLEGLCSYIVYHIYTLVAHFQSTLIAADHINYLPLI